MDALSVGRVRRVLGSRGGALFVDLLVVVALAAGALGVALGPVRTLWPAEHSYLVITMLSAAVAAGAGVLAELVTRMGGQWQDARIAAALFVYGLVVVPTTTVDPGPDADVVALQTARFVASVGVVALLALSLWSGGPRTRATAWPSVLVISAIVLVVGISAARFPVEAIDLLTAVAGHGAFEGYALVGVMMTGFGLARRQRTFWRIGLGVLVLAIAQGVLQAGSASVSDPYLPFAVLRLAGVGAVLAAVAVHAGALSRAERARQEAERAQLQAMREEEQRRRERNDERDHEMRNALVGLSGAARLLGQGGAALPEGDQGELRTAVEAELARLRDLLERSAARPAGEEAELAPLLQQLVTLRRTAGTDIELQAPAELRTTASSATVAQVLTNLLANCERHAPGARVRIRAAETGGTIRIEVSDDGPGLAPGTEELVVQRQFGDRRKGGSGLGLHVSAELLDVEGGRLTMLPSTRNNPGCTAVVEVPASAAGSDTGEAAHEDEAPAAHAEEATTAHAEKTQPINRVRLMLPHRANSAASAAASQDRACIGTESS
ncbi:two-component system OmpR family sensor kinase [Halopolyspora algeriensis]|uniref:Two-component system OmpR family sensor kinase n=1 Tax=Halopolyspora algeriensis TaxID=1500506 RepID=A0A368VTX0_9ACTN|nr:HAMP domain-containing sensor histidine kinase [Halopolyspora algeriensis]RCW45261.1 two-component system OmpR family sensor kinase [Halopolyspora algeriensis]TQM53020.1 two-component system OmpR family sensor kinase [Halopolyspora algeriensis]